MRWLQRVKAPSRTVKVSPSAADTNTQASRKISAFPRSALNFALRTLAGVCGNQIDSAVEVSLYVLVEEVPHCEHFERERVIGDARIGCAHCMRAIGPDD